MGEINHDLGKALEDKGDYSRALEIYVAEGLSEDAKRVKDSLRTIDLAEFFAKHREYRRAVDILFDGGLTKEAERFAERVEKADTPDSHYAQIRVLANSGRLEDIAQHAERLHRFGPYGVYLTALAILDIAPENTRAIADWLSEKPQKVEEVQEGEGRKMFMNITDPEEAGSTMAAYLTWSMVSIEDKLSYALRLYDKIGDATDAEGCLNMLKGLDHELYSYGLLHLRDTDNILPDELSHNARIIFKIISGKSKHMFENWEKNSSPKEILEVYKETARLIGCNAHDVVEHSDLLRVLHLIDAKKEAMAKEETRIMESYEESVQEAVELDVIKNMYDIAGRRFKFSDKRHSFMLGIIDRAAALTDDIDAQLFALEEYRQRDTDIERPLACAKRMYKLGDVKKAVDSYKSLAFMARASYRRREYKKEKLYDVARDMEQECPYISLQIYGEFRDKENVERLAGAIIENGNFDEIKGTAWVMSYINKKGFLMRDLLLKLEGFGESGKEAANDVRIEMRVPNIFNTD